MTLSRLLAISFWLWVAFVAFFGMVAAGLHCEGGCPEPGSASWLEPWTWDDYDVFPRVAYPALASVVAATGMVISVFLHRRLAAAVTFAGAILLLSYPYFVSFPNQTEVRGWLWIGSLFGLAALLTSRRPREALAV